MLCMLIFCLLTRILTDCSSVMLDGGSVPSVFWVVLVKGMSLWMRVRSPPPPDLVRSFLSRVYPGISNGLDLGLSFVSCMTAMWMSRSCSSCLSSFILFCIPSILICRMFRLSMDLVLGAVVCGVVCDVVGAVVCDVVSAVVCAVVSAVVCAVVCVVV